MLPTVYINSGATFMENYFMAQEAIQEKGQIIWPSRTTVPFMAIDDIGEVAAKVLLSGDRHHIGAFHTINNGHGPLDSFGAARVMSEAWGKRIDAVDDKEVFVSEYRHLMGESWGSPSAIDCVIFFFKKKMRSFGPLTTPLKGQ